MMLVVASTLRRGGARRVCPPAALFTSSAGRRRAQGRTDDPNPLLGHGALPRFDEIDVDTHLQPAVEAALATLRAGVRAAEERLQECTAKYSAAEVYALAVDDVERAGAPLQFSWGVATHLLGVANSDALREAHEALLPLVVAEAQAVQQSSAVFEALERARSMPDYAALNGAQRRIVDATLQSMERAGVGLADDRRAAFNVLQQECATLHQTVQNNVLDATKEFRLDVTDKARLKGLPPTALALASSLWNEAHSAGDDGVADGGDADNGPWALTLDHPSLLPSLQHLEDRSLREQLYRASREIAAAGGCDNSPHIRRILELRREMAGMLGMDTYAELSLSSKMASSPADVTRMSEMLKAHARPFAEKELAELQFFAEGECSFQHGRLQHWDVPYYSERLREHRYSYTDEEIRPYFSLPNVQEGLFKLARDLFGVEIVEGGKDVQCWHPDTRFFHVNDISSSEHIASFYLDPYSRPHEKRGGAWMDTCVGKSRATGQRIPVAYLVCNGSPPTGDGVPSLMTFREVETLFHEFGHGIQHMLTAVDEGGAAGINNVEWDAVELPSQFMENWCYHDKTLLGFAKHYRTGEPLPRALFDKIKAARQFQQGLMMMRQLFLGQVDMALHSIPAGGDIDPLGVQNELAEDYLVMPPLESDRQLNSFLHIFGGSSYAAGYYSYKWAEVLSADAFAAFEEAGLDDDEAMRELGARFRDTVLAQGGAKHPMDVFTEFRGRAPEHDALLRHSGLVESSS
jgi:oligopeptidase A